MITKAILIIWIGWGQSQVMSMTTMDTYDECTRAKTALVQFDRKLKADCVPYEVAQ